MVAIIELPIGSPMEREVSTPILIYLTTLLINFLKNLVEVFGVCNAVIVYGNGCKKTGIKILC